MHDFPVLEFGIARIDIASFITIIITFAATFLVARLAVRNLSVTNPSKMQNFMEWVIEFVQGIVASTMDLKKGKVYISLGITLIMFIFISNLLGLPLGIVTEHHEEFKLFGQTLISEETIHANEAAGEHSSFAWWKSPTADVSVTFGLALIIFVTTNYLGLSRNRKHYLKHYIEPYWFFFPLNVIKEVTKPLTLGLRLYANIFAGEVLISTILMMGPIGIPLLAAWQGFSLFVAGIQAFLFTILTMVYISQATTHHEEH